MAFRKWFPAWIFPVLVVLAIGTVWLRLMMIRTTYEIDQADRSLNQLRIARETTELRVTGLRSPRHLEGLAKTRFNLVPPKSEQVIHLHGH
ncbi:MAG: hypothetical protein ACXWPM_07550 [Bdellovibrionota bacterium]